MTYLIWHFLFPNRRYVKQFHSPEKQITLHNMVLTSFCQGGGGAIKTKKANATFLKK